nr:RsmF rRNA methyltransferase first C-terminal domain-containing protein [uncultured Peptostreptococcus sp.]
MTTSNSTNKALKEGVLGEVQDQFNINDKPSSLPKAFLREMEDLLGDEYQAFLDSYRDENTSAIRVNTLKLPIESFKDLGLFNIDFERDKISWTEEGYYLSGDVNPGKNPLHDAGAYYIQEPSAMSVVGQTPISEGDRVLDLCAAPGGKSTYILSRLNHKGLLVSNEINPSRIRALGENLERFGAVNSIITNSDSSNLLTFFKGFFDKIFIDAPCSGQGMFRKDDFAIEDWSQDKVDECVAIQRQLIRDAYQMLRAGGMIIYSTCTFTRQENEAIIEDFLGDYPDANLLDMDRIWPHRDRGEGHFCARITKKVDKQGDQDVQDSDLLAFDKDSHRDSSRESAKKSKKKQRSKAKSNRKNQEYLGLYEDFATDYLIDGGLRKLLEPGLAVKEERLYYQPLDYDLRGLKVLRSGLFVGEFKKNRFEPAHSLAMALKPSDVKYTLDFASDSDEIRAYLRGESIRTGQSRGWVLVSVDGISLGWGKESNGILKNKYPKGLRR